MQLKIIIPPTSNLEIGMLSLFLIYLIITSLSKYSNGEMSSFSLPSYKTPAIFLNTVIANNISLILNYSSECEIRTNTTLLIQCTSPGFHNVKLQIENETLSTWVPFDNTPYCYWWDVSYFYNVSATSFSLFVWINDGQSSTILSNSLTHQFLLLGDYPRVVPSDNNNMMVHYIGFNNSFWEFQLLGLVGDLYSYTLTIDDSIVSLLDCIVKSTSFVISRSKYSIDSLITVHNQVSTLLNDTGNGLQLFRDTAAPSVAIVIQGNINIMTQDSFRTYSIFEVNGYTGSIKDVVYTSTGIVLLIDQEIITLMNESTSIHSPSGLASSILENNVFHITGRGRDIIYDNYDIVIAWSHTVMLLYVSIDSGKSFSNVTIPISSDNVTIQSLQVHPVKDEALMFYTANNNTFFLCYDVRQREWSNATVSNGNSPEQLLVKYFPSPFGDMIIWGRQSVYYSLTGDNLLPLTILQNYSSEYQWKNDEYIRHVDTGSSGQVALVLSDGSLFYGRIATGQLLKILYYVNDNSTIFFDSLGNLKFLSMLESNGSISVRTVPVYSLLLSALYPPLACPYLQWTHSIAQSDVYYIDIHDTFTVWVSLVPRVWSPNNVSVSFSNVGAINKDIQSTEEQTALQGSVKRNISITVAANYSTGYTVMRLSPVTHSLTCDKLAQENVEIFVACPPERHIGITRGTTCTELEGYMYTIPNDHYDPEMKGRTNVKGLQDKVVRYNVTQWGCPIRVLHNENYKPVLFLYDGNTLNERVGVDFVIREIHGRTDFSYTATAEDVGCRRAPQTWQEILANTEDPYKAWTPQNYQNCFEGSGSLSSSSAELPYQILNSSNGGSYIQWGTRNGIYVFEATVIAKDYSFCNLTVLFAVQVYSVQNLSYIAYILFVVTCMTSGVVLFLSFLFYKRLLYTGNLLFKRQTSKTISSSKSNSGQL